MNSFDEIQSLLQDKADIQARIKLIPYDGNKRASVIFANHYLISHGQGFLVIPEEHVPEFKKMLVDLSYSNSKLLF